MDVSTNAERPNPCQGPASNSALTNANNAGSTIQAQANKRSFPTQLPIVLAATIYPPAYGMSQALIVPDDMCPGCSCWHSHRIRYPAPVMVLRKARCGTRYELALHKPTVKRSRRAA